MLQKYSGLLSTALLLALFAAGMVGALLSMGWANATQAMAKIGYERLALLLAFTCCHHTVRAARWHILARAAGLPTTLRQNLRHFFGGFAMTATPGRLGELVRLRWVGRETGWAVGRSAPILLADRTTELAGMALLIAIAVSFSNLGTKAVWPLLGLTVLVVWIVCRPRLMTRIIGLPWRLTGKGARTFVQLRRMSMGMASFTTSAILIPATLLSLLGWLVEGVAFFLLLSWLGAPINLSAAIAIFLTSLLSGALSGLPGGLGGTEAACIALLLIQGVGLETALLATAIIRVTTLWFTVLIGLCVFPFSEMRSHQQKV